MRRCASAALLLALPVIVLGLIAPSAQAYRLDLVRVQDANWYGPGSYIGADQLDLGPGELVRYDVYLDTEGESGITSFSAGITYYSYPSDGLIYRPDLSHAESNGLLYAPPNPSGLPETYLRPVADPPTNGPPGGAYTGSPNRSRVNVDFVASNGIPTVATDTNLYLGRVVFETAAEHFYSEVVWGHALVTDTPTRSDSDLVFEVNGVDVFDEVTMVVGWAPEPSTALLVGVGLGLVGVARRADRSC